jgi:hypothetical protein
MFLRCVTLLCQSNYTKEEARHVRLSTIETVVLAEYVLPRTEQNIQWHLLIHLADDIIDKGPILFYWVFRHERYWGYLIKTITRKTSPEIGITMAMSRRLRPLVLRSIVHDVLIRIATSQIEGNAVAASHLLKYFPNEAVDAWQAWLTERAHADQGAVIKQDSIICTLQASTGKRYLLSSTEANLLARHLSIATSVEIRVHDYAWIHGGRLYGINTREGRKYPCKSFVEMRHDQQVHRRARRGRWWAQVTKFVSCGNAGTEFAFLRTFPTRYVRSNMGEDFVLNGLDIPEDAFEFFPFVEKDPDFVVPITSIWSQCIVIPWVGAESHTGLVPHIIFPTRRDEYLL